MSRRPRGTDPSALWVADCEVMEDWRIRPVNDDPARQYLRARILVREDRRPVGFVDVPIVDGEVQGAQVRDAGGRLLATRSEPPIAASGAPDLLRGTGAPPPFTVAVCTRDHPAQLARCLERLVALEYPSYEVLVVDNAPSTEATRTLVEAMASSDERVRYLREPQVGLSNARNRALFAARNDWVAFTDDDVVADPWWLEGLARGVARDPRTSCVTGLVPVARLATAAERYFDARTGWHGRMTPAVFSVAAPPTGDPMFPYHVGLLGTGANFAVDRRVLLELGGFDRDLGVGSPSGGGEDVDAFVRILRSSHSLVYEPSAIVWHFHRSSAQDLSRQMRDYGRGLGAITAKWLARRDTRREVLERAVPAIRHLLATWSRAVRPTGVPPTLALRCTAAEVAGVVGGPLRYRRATRRPAARSREGRSEWRSEERIDAS